MPQSRAGVLNKRNKPAKVRPVAQEKSNPQRGIIRAVDGAAPLAFTHRRSSLAAVWLRRER